MYYIRANGFGGGMIWAIDLDDFIGQCGEKWPLLSTMNKILKCKLNFKFTICLMYQIKMSPAHLLANCAK